MDDTDNQERSQTRGEFCDTERISLSSYFKLKARNLAPEETVVPGTKMIRIAPEARRAWHARMAELAKSEAAQLEAERRRAQAVAAGRIAARSPLHASRRPRRQSRRRG
jgi:hypothetical protein